MQHKKFDDLTLSTELQRAVADMGFEDLTPIQSRSIPLILDGKDIIGQAQTGTGKTLAFGIPILELLAQQGRNLEALVLCPTRELAVQVAEELKRLAKYRRDVHIVPVYGGQPIQKQFNSLKRGARIVVGTPGRIMDHMNRGTLRFDAISMVVLDEADKMLDMGFVDDMKTILWAMPEDRQTLLFSATIHGSIMDLMRKFQKDPHIVNVAGRQLTVPQVEQIYFEVKPWMKLDMLCRLIDMYKPASSLVFCNTKRGVDKIVKALQTRGYCADSLHGDMKQSRRDQAMLKFRKRLSSILVATDVAARGLDVTGIEAVINYDLPQDEQYYVHRIGRTARMGRSGRAFSLVLPWELEKLREIQAFAKTKIIRHATPLLKGQEKEKRSSVAAKAGEPERRKTRYRVKDRQKPSKKRT
jgi:ATP-dependent RNA helicase DeaD